MVSLFEDYAAISASGLFDADYYISKNPDVSELNYDPLLHYLEFGAREGRNPNPDFDAKTYVERCRELGEEPENPLLHFIKFGTAVSRPSSDEAAPEVLISLDRASLLYDAASERWQVLGEGWVVASQPVVEVKIGIGRTGSIARYGLSRRDVAEVYPHYPRSEQSGFAFTLTDIPSEETQGSLDVVFAIRTADGRSHAHTISTHLATIEPESKPPAAPAEQTYRGLLPLKLEVDACTVDDTGILRMTGWAVCFAPIVTVQVFVDDKRIGAAHHGQQRDDVALAYPDYPGANLAGFSISSDIGAFGAGRRSVRVEAIASTGISRELTLFADMTEPTKKTKSHDSGIRVFSDAIELGTDGWLAAEGWAVCPSETEEILIELDGKVVGTAEIGRERADVGNLFPDRPHARRAGFRFCETTPPIAEGEHMIVLRVRDVGGAEAEVPLPVLARADLKRPSAVEIVQVAGNDLMKFNIDLPQRFGGAMTNPVRGNLEIAGWAVARHGVAGIDVAIDGEFLTSAFTGVRRLDVQAQFGDWPNALTSGFTALLSHRVLPAGGHTISLTLRDTLGNTALSEFAIEVEEAPETIGPWSLRGKMPLAEANLDDHVLAGLHWRPRFTIVMGVDKSEESISLARATLMSIAAQTYSDLRILIVPQGKSKPDALAGKLLKGLAELRECAEVVKRPAAPPTGLDGGFLMLLKPGDILSCDALAEFAIESGLHRDADFIYADDRRPNPATQVIEAFFKPDWSPDLLLSTNYIGRAWCAGESLIAHSGLTLDEIARTGSYELVLKLTEAATGIHHVSSVALEDSKAEAETPAAARKALTDTLARRGIDGGVEDGATPGALRVRRAVTTQGLVSIIIPTCAARGLIKICLDTLREKTAYRNFEIVCIENIPAGEQEWKTWLRQNADVVIETDEPFNWSRFNNLAVAQSRGEFLLFLNDDIEIIKPDWLDVLLEHAQRPEVGVVGPQLLYPDRRVQHAGMFLAAMGIARHAFRYFAEDDPGYFGLALTQRNVIAVTGACLLTRRDTYEAVGRFDEVHTVVNNDLDFCLRIWRAGLRTIYTPHTTLIHHEQASRADIGDIYDTGAFESEWANLFVAGDPFFHPRLSKERDDLSCEWEPVQLLCPGRPVYDRDTIQNILVVKLDHIGDCVTALPAIRRLKTFFSTARLHVLTSRSSKSVWALEPAIDEVIEFDFFHARSALGHVEHTEEDWQLLSDRLSSYRFDLAVDLRKHSETRPVLLKAGARYLAGYDHKGRFPWLDIGLEWSEDQAAFHKRQHAADDLINLVDAIVAAADPDRDLIVPRRHERPKVSGARHLFKKRVICIHPAAGNDMKQWPPEYFALLINQLLAQEDVHIAIVGGPDDAPIATTILDKVTKADKVWSMVGVLTLAELPDFIAACALFVGNDSGPKHIAAGLGIPTVGIHSGIVDSREWGPIGKFAVGIDRDMTCSPCYRSKPEECHRSLACLRQILPGDVYRICNRMLSLQRGES